MGSITLQNSVLAGTGVIYDGNVVNLKTIVINIDDNGGGSTITFASSADDSSFSNMTTGVYTVDSAGQLVPLGGATATAKGRYTVDVDGINYLKVSVTSYVSGNVISRFQESVTSIKGLTALFQTGLTAQGNSQASAYPIQARYNQFSTTAASTGAILPVNVSKSESLFVRNDGASTLTVYPPVGYKINGGTTNAGVSVAAGAKAQFVSDGAGNFWQFI